MRAVASLLVTVLVAAACGAPGDPGAPGRAGDTEVVAAVDRATPAADAPVEELVAGLTAFAYELRTALAEPGENTVFSPLSIALAFGMARAGAAGTTAEEIDAVLGFPADVHAAFNVLEQALVTSDGPPPVPDRDAERDASTPPQPPVVAIANGLFAQAGLALEQAFLETLAIHYGAGVHAVDFAEADATKDLLDAWVSEQTAELIEELFAEVDPRWLLVLANAVYLKADWDVPFVEHPITDRQFTRVDGSKTDVATMRRLDTLPYGEGDGWQAVELAYAHSDLAMRVIVPVEVSDPGALLAPEVLAGVEAGLDERVVDLYLPQWDYDTDIVLVELLRDLRMHAPFGDADFSGITGERDLFIDEAIHRATITVDEWGTEAAAVTGLAFAESGPPEPEAVVRADRPFAYVIVHRPTGAPLFAGTVADPGA